MTYSIVARDPITGELGVAVQTRWFNVGAGVPWAAPGVGAVATQSYTEIAHGPNGLDRLRAGRSATETLAELLEADDGREIRQVGIVDARGGSAAWTGRRCVPAAGHVTADGVSVQANMMESAEVWPAMLAAFRAVDGPLAERLVAALDAGEAAGGDARGRQSAALLVVPGDPAAPAWRRAIDLRVEDAAEPLVELRRLLRIQRANDAMERADTATEAGDRGATLAGWAEAHDLAPDDDQVAIWRAVALAGTPDGLPEAVDELRRVSAINDRWPGFLERFAAAGPEPAAVEPARRLLEEWRSAS